MKVKDAIFIILIFFLVFPLFANEIIVKEDGSFSAKANLNLRMEWGAFGIPSGTKQAGNNVFFDLDKNRCWIEPIEGDLFSSSSQRSWDIAITYTLKEVAMGPMGKHRLPFLDAVVNDKEGGSYYMVEATFSDVKAVDPLLFRENGWSGYGLRDFRDNRKIAKEKYKNSFPFFCYDWYEVASMRKFDYRAYAGRVFVVRTTQNQYYKIQFIQVKGLTADSLFEVHFSYLPLESDLNQ